MSHVFNHPLPVVHFPPQLVAFPQSVGGLSVCAHRLTQADTEAYRATDTKTNGHAGVVTSFSLKRLHCGRVIWLPIVREYYVHGQTIWPIITYRMND